MASTPQFDKESNTLPPARVRELRHLLLARPTAFRILAALFGAAEAEEMLRPFDMATEIQRNRLISRNGGRRRYLKEMLA